jgi:hypothetical protein
LRKNTQREGEREIDGVFRGRERQSERETPAESWSCTGRLAPSLLAPVSEEESWPLRP